MKKILQTSNFNISIVSIFLLIYLLVNLITNINSLAEVHVYSIFCLNFFKERMDLRNIRLRDNLNSK